MSFHQQQSVSLLSRMANRRSYTNNNVYSKNFFNSSIKVLTSLNSLYTEAKRT